MDEIIKSLVDTDKEARQLVEEAESYLASTISGMDREVGAFKETYAKKAADRIGLIRQQESVESAAAVEDIGSRFAMLLNNLNTQYEKNHDQWEEELFNRCITL